MHDHLLTVHAHKSWRDNNMLPVCAKLLITNLVQCACADGSEPIIA